VNRRIRAVLAALALLILLAGVPVALLFVAGSPIPGSWPTWHSVSSTLLLQPDNGTLFLPAVRLVSWIAWAAFAIATLTEIVAQVRGRNARRLPGLGGVQRLVAYLLTTITVGLASGVPAAFASGPAANPPAAMASDRVQIVGRGDTLSAIAQRDLGDWQDYREVFTASQHLAQPDGYHLTNPNAIYPGERLLIPRPVAHTAPTTVAGKLCSESVPSQQVVQAPSPSHDAGTSSPVHPAASAHPAVDRPDFPAASVITYGALLSSVLMNVLTLKRRIQQRRRRPGRRIRMSSQMSTVERGLRMTAEPGSVALLDRALRSLAACVAARDAVLPVITGALVTGQGVELLLAEAAAPVPPFTSSNVTSWRLDTGSKALLGAAAAAGVSAPFPALVTLGDSQDGAHTLVDLVTAGAISLHGSSRHVREVLTAIALELAGSPWADYIVVNCAGFGAELPQLIGTGRLRYADGTDGILAEMRAQASEVTDVLASSGVTSIGEARSSGVGGDSWTPQILLSATPLTPDQFAVVSDLVSADTGTVNLAAVIAAADDGAALPGPWQLDVTPGRMNVLPQLDREIRLQRVTDEQYSHFTADLTVASDETDVAADNWPEVPGEPEILPPVGLQQVTEPLVEEPDEPAAPYIRVLGRVEVAGRDVAGIESGKRNLMPELAAYLRLNQGRGAEEISRAMGGPRGPWAPSTRASNMSRLRAWLGRDPSGKNYIPALGEGQLYTLAGGVGCDWEDFQHLARSGLQRCKAGETDAGIDDLRSAMRLVRGQPFSGAGPHSYVWAEFLKQEMISAIVDVAHALAVNLMEVGEPAGARKAATQGLTVEPGSELLYRDLFKAEHQAGNAAGIEEAAERLMVTLAELGLDMEPTTAELLEQLRNPRRPLHQKRVPS
jgi:hypothetical protein